MRVTNNQIYDNLLSGVTKQLQVQADANAAVSSGKRFQRPSQAGLDYKISLDLRQTQTQIQGSLEALNTADSRLNASQTMLHDISNVLTRAQTIAVQQASAQIGSQEHLAALAEVNHLLDRVANASNQSFLGESLFAGSAVDKPAFAKDISGHYVYQGALQDRTVAITSSQNISSNIRGDTQAFADTFAALQNFQAALSNSDTSGISTAIGELTNANNGIVDLTSRVGGQISAIQSYRTSYEDMQFAIEKRMNSHEAADIPSLVAQLQTAENALQASYSQIAKVGSLSLVNFLR
ncbi:MAG: hypothetical protein AUK35_01965 [Zetaproteobacteria bacterium CG2_30_46_52]|nr:MAG: hypothetical protein AUK35_01965 [Zetaproteobacteria bacterium CG2_30_46_52]